MNRTRRVTLYLSSRADIHLQKLTERLGISRVKMLRDALRLYEWIVDQYSNGVDFYAVGKDGVTERVVLLGVEGNKRSSVDDV